MCLICVCPFYLLSFKILLYLSLYFTSQYSLWCSIFLHSIFPKYLEIFLTFSNCLPFVLPLCFFFLYFYSQYMFSCSIFFQFTFFFIFCCILLVPPSGVLSFLIPYSQDVYNSFFIIPPFFISSCTFLLSFPFAILSSLIFLTRMCAFKILVLTTLIAVSDIYISMLSWYVLFLQSSFTFLQQMIFLSFLLSKCIKWFLVSLFWWLMLKLLELLRRSMDREEGWKIPQQWVVVK